MSEKMVTRPQERMLRDFEHAYPRPLGHTPELGSLMTWRRLIDAGLIKGNLITDAGREALKQCDKRRR